MSTEQASVDCGLLETKGALDNIELPERIFAIDGAADPDIRFLPLDVKQLNANSSAIHIAGYFAFAIQYRQDQRSCPAFIVQNPAAPDLVAIIPHQYMDRRWPQPSKTFRYCSLDVPITSQPICLFPPEWSPLVFPIEYTSQALDSLWQFAHGKGPW
jgi:hypothetical protein